MMSLSFPRKGLYAITQPEGRSIEQVLVDVEAVLRGGAKVVQYRDKQPEDAQRLASELVDLCHRYGVPLLVNDNMELALIVGADGVHLGRDDGEILAARQLLGDSAIIGVSCYNDLDRAYAAQKQGADYVAFGRFFPSDSKPLAAPAELTTLQLAQARLKLPIVAIGGILPSNGEVLLQAGADLLAVIGGLYSNDPQLAAEQYSQLFQ